MRYLPAELQALSDQASAKFLGGGAGNLTEAVREVVSGQSLGEEQVRRVAEMANRVTWQQLHRTAEDKTVQFDPVDPTALLGGPRPEVESQVPQGPLDSPQLSPANQRPGTVEDLLREYRLPREVTAVQLEGQAKAAQDEAELLCTRALQKMASGGERFIDEVHRMIFEHEATGVEILSAVAGATENPNLARGLVKLAFQEVRRSHLNPGLGAGAVPVYLTPDPNHPLLQALRDYEEGAAEVTQADRAVGRLQKLAAEARRVQHAG